MLYVQSVAAASMPPEKALTTVARASFGPAPSGVRSSSFQSAYVKWPAVCVRVVVRAAMSGLPALGCVAAPQPGART